MDEARTESREGHLANTLAHEFNNQLTAILGWANLLARSLDVSDPRRGDVEEILGAVRRARALVDQLLALASRRMLRTTAVELNRFIAQVTPGLRSLLPEDITLETSLTSGQVLIRADVAELEQMLVAMVLNARDAMPAGGRVTIETNGAADRVALRVRDTGHGLSADILPRIFDPDFTTKPRGRNGGLGLAGIRQVVEQIGGDVSAAHDPGGGAVFTLHLPVAHESTAPDLPVTRPDPVRAKCVLVVEDESSVRFLVRTILSRAGYRVIDAAGPDDALAWLAKGEDQLDLLITDVVMPNGGGPELCDRILAERPDLRVLFMSGYTDDALMPERLQRSGIAFIQKPFGVDELSRKVEEVLGA